MAITVLTQCNCKESSNEMISDSNFMTELFPLRKVKKILKKLTKDTFALTQKLQ